MKDDSYEISSWLLSGDPSIQYMMFRFLHKKGPDDLARSQEAIGDYGFAARLLACQNADGHWGRHYYQPKWTSTHYTLLDLKNLYVPRDTPACRQMTKRMFAERMKEDGSINLAKSDLPSDVCVDGMILNYASYFHDRGDEVKKLVDFILQQQKPDGGFTWNLKAEIGDPHTTICVLEGLREYQRAGFANGKGALDSAIRFAELFLISSDLFMLASDKRFLKLSYPYRYHYSLFRALDYFADVKTADDADMQTAITWLKGKRKKDGRWTLEYKYPGSVHFDMEKVGEPSRFITLKAIKILASFGEGSRGIPD